MKKSHRYWALLLVVSLLLSCMPVHALEIGDEGQSAALTTIGVVSDTHIRLGDAAEAQQARTNLAQAIDRYNTMAGGTLDAFVSVGDNTDNGTAAEQAEFKRIVDENLADGTQFTAVMGNHEFYKDGWGIDISPEMRDEMQNIFTETVGVGIENETVVNGIHILSVSPDNHMDSYQAREAFLREKIQAAAQADGDKPIILVAHKPARYTTMSSGDGPDGGYSSLACDWTDDFVEFLKDYPQIIYISGHAHDVLTDENTMYQQDFTSVQGGFTSTDDPMGLFITVDENNLVTIHRVHTNTGTEETPWTIDIPAVVQDKSNFQYRKVNEVKNVHLEVGGTPDQLYVSWLSSVPQQGVVEFSKSGTSDQTASVAAADFASANDAGHYYNHALLTGLEADTEYRYRVGNENGWSDYYTFHTPAESESYEFLVMADPQIGSGSLEADQAAWKSTVAKASELFPNADFLLSLGDQVDSAASSAQYDAFFSAEELTGLPLAPVVGNHDFLAPTYSQYFAAPNVSGYGSLGASGKYSGDYYFINNGVLFLTLNTNNLNIQEHINFMQETIQSVHTAGTKVNWTVVEFHHPLFSASGHAEDADVLLLREALAPVLSDLDVDVVFNGHDHMYTRSYMMQGTTPVPEAGSGATIANPEFGQVLYFTGSTASGGKFYEKLNDYDYAAYCVQNYKPQFTHVSVTGTSLSVQTYTSDGNEVVDQITLEKTETLTGDQMKPFLYLPTENTVLLDSAFDPMEGVSAYDLTDGVLTNITYEGSVNTAEAGSYTLVYSVTDRAGNTARAERIVKVQKEIDDSGELFLYYGLDIKSGALKEEDGSVAVCTYKDEGGYTFSHDDTLNQNILSGPPAGNLRIKGVNTKDLNGALTVEAYIKVEEGVGDYDVFQFDGQNVNLVSSTTAGEFTWFGAGRLNGDTDIVDRNLLPVGEWIHVICTAKNGSQVVYVDGQKLFEASHDQIKLDSANGDSLVLGGYYGRSGDVDYAYLRVYGGYVNADEALSMYSTMQNNFRTASYEKVDEALAEVPDDLSAYTAESVAVLEAAVNAVVRGLDANQQAKVDGYADAIRTAISKLVSLKLPLYYGLDIASGSLADETGSQITGTFTKENDEISFRTDAALQQSVLHLPETGGLVISGADTSALQDAYTIETYIRLPQSSETVDIFSVGDQNINCVAMTDQTFFGAGRYTDGDADVVAGQRLPMESWIHLTMTAKEGEQVFYVNGKEFARESYTVFDADSRENSDFILGQSSEGRIGNFDMAYFRVYSGFAGPETVSYLYKTMTDPFMLADYSAVKEAIASIPEDLSVYTDATVKAVQDAQDTVDWNKRPSQQAEVDAYAKAIADAVSQLVIKDIPLYYGLAISGGSFADEAGTVPDTAYTGGETFQFTRDSALRQTILQVPAEGTVQVSGVDLSTMAENGYTVETYVRLPAGSDHATLFSIGDGVVSAVVSTSEISFSGGAAEPVAGQAITAGQWVHVVCTAKNGAQALYINGVLSSEGEEALTLDGASTVTLGNSAMELAYFRIYSGYAIAEKAADLYHAIQDGVAGADYTPVNDALAQVPACLDRYPQGADAVQAAIDAVDWNLNASEQARVQEMAEEILSSLKDLSLLEGHNLHYGLEFTADGYADAIGSDHQGSYQADAGFTTVYDENVGGYVLQEPETGSLTVTAPDTNELNQSYIIETYVKIPAPGSDVETREIDIFGVGYHNINLTILEDEVYFGSGKYDGDGDADIAAAKHLPYDQWTHIVCTAKDGEQVLYVDGEEFARGSYENLNIATSWWHDLRLGNMFDWRMGGIKMASWRIYDGFADAALAAAMYENYLYADYTDVEAALKLVPVNLSGYTDESVLALRSAIAAVDWTLSPSEQSQVDTYAAAIADAVEKLELKEPEIPTVTELVISRSPAKTAYQAGEFFSPAGMEVTALYSDGTSQAVTDYTYTPNGALTTSDKIITVTYAGKSAQVEISVVNSSQPSGSTAYTVAVSDSVNGAVTVSPKSASKGDTVTITVKPDAGYELDELVVTDKDGKALKLTGKGDGKYTFTMPAFKVTVEATFVESKTMDNPFVDVNEDAYYFNSVLWAVENGVTSGTSAATFAPNAACTRAQAITFLWRAMGSPEPAMTENPFSDVAADAYYYKAVLWAVQQGITSGTTAATFSPDAAVTRAQTVAFLWRASGSPKASAENSFVDVSAGAYYTGAVLWAAQQGITSGTSATTFDPGSDCTRAQIVTFLWRAMAA